MKKKYSHGERFKKGPMSVAEIKAMREEEEQMMLETEKNANIYVIRAGEEKISVEVGNTFKIARKEMGLTQQEVADASGVKRPNIARLESGKHSPTVDMLNHIADSMGMDMEIHLIEREK